MTALETSIAGFEDGTPGLTPPGSDAAVEDFSRLATRVRARIHAWARRLTGDRDDAEDIAQDVLMRLHSRVHTIEDQGRVMAWLYRVTHNVVHDRRELARRRSELMLRFGQDPERSDPGDARDLATEGLARLEAGYRDELSSQQQRVFSMIDPEGRSTAEVADELGLSPSTVRVHLARARQTIRLRMLAEHPELLEEYDR